MSNFFQSVYEIVARIPKGKVATYGQIAAILGNPAASRAVGWAMQSAPSHLNIPCHRVVNKSGSMAPAYAFGGPEKQQALLRKEGVVFKADGHIDMQQSLWKLE